MLWSANVLVDVHHTERIALDAYKARLLTKQRFYTQHPFIKKSGNTLHYTNL